MPLVHSENITDACRLLVWQLIETAEDLYESLPAWADREELAATSHPQKKREWMAGRIVLNQLVEKENLTIKGLYKDEHGKPFLLDCPCYISLTHTHDYVAAVLDSTQSVGIDMEKKNDKLIRTAGKYLNDDERALATNQLPLLSVYWCGKEALYKLNGRKKVSFKDDISIDGFAADVLVATGQLRDSDRSLTARLHIRWLEDYCLVVAVCE